MTQFNLVGPSYASQSINADCQITRNWYPEFIESQMGKSKLALYPYGGSKLFCDSGGGLLNRGSLEINNRAFSVIDTHFKEIFSNGSSNTIGEVLNDFGQCSMTASPQQLLFCSGGGLYVYYLQAVGAVPAGTFVTVDPSKFVLPSGANGPISKVGYVDGFFLALLANSQTFYYSTPLDASSWPGLQKNIVSVFSDNVVDMQIAHRQVWMLGRKKSVVYYNSGSSSQFDVIPGSDMETGTVGIFASCVIDNTVFWMKRDQRGAGVLVRANGYTPARISNHAAEFAWQGYALKYGEIGLSDVVLYPIEDQGHAFVYMYFRTANVTWVYDVATGMLSERRFGEGIAATAHRSQNHMLAFGKHLIGDWATGNLYEMNINIYDDFGTPIERLRRATHISNENKWTFFSELILDIEAGVGPQPPLLDGNGNPRGPQVMLRWSNDYGHTFSNEYMLDAGQAGAYKYRMRKSRLGRARDRVFQIKTTDPVPWRVIGGYVEMEPQAA